MLRSKRCTTLLLWPSCHRLCRFSFAAFFTTNHPFSTTTENPLEYHHRIPPKNTIPNVCLTKHSNTTRYHRISAARCQESCVGGLWDRAEGSGVALLSSDHHLCSSTLGSLSSPHPPSAALSSTLLTSPCRSFLLHSPLLVSPSEGVDTSRVRSGRVAAWGVDCSLDPVSQAEESGGSERVEGRELRMRHHLSTSNKKL